MSTEVKEPEPVTAASEKRSRMTKGLYQLLAFGGLLVIYAFFALISPSFRTSGNLISILFSAVVIGILALGELFVIITAGIDLSVGTGMTLMGVLSGLVVVNAGMPAWVGVLAALGGGMVMGCINGLAVSYLKLPPFIATLAMMMIAEGLALVVSGSAPIYFDQDPSYGKISTGEIIPGIPNALLVFLVAAIIASVALNKTVLGRYDVSIGSNAEATRLSGVNVKKWTVAIYTLAGVFTGLAGVMISARLSSAQPAVGTGYEMNAIAATVIGGASLAGGKGSVSGAVIGALIISVINNGLQIVGVPQEWQTVVLGLVIMGAVMLDSLRRRGN